MSANNCPTCGSMDTHQEVTPYGFMRTCNNCGFVFKQK